MWDNCRIIILRAAIHFCCEGRVCQRNTSVVFHCDESLYANSSRLTLHAWSVCCSKDEDAADGCSTVSNNCWSETGGHRKLQVILSRVASRSPPRAKNFAVYIASRFRRFYIKKKKYCKEMKTSGVQLSSCGSFPHFLTPLLRRCWKKLRVSCMSNTSVRGCVILDSVNKISYLFTHLPHRL